MSRFQTKIQVFARKLLGHHFFCGICQSDLTSIFLKRITISENVTFFCQDSRTLLLYPVGTVRSTHSVLEVNPVFDAMYERSLRVLKRGSSWSIRAFPLSCWPLCIYGARPNDSDSSSYRHIVSPKN